MIRFLSKLTALKVAGLAEPGLYCDGGGLWLQVSPTRTKSWVFRYSVDGKRHHMGLGSLRDVSLAEARRLASEIGRRVRAGEDPLAERRAGQVALRATQSRRMTFNACARAFIKAHRASWRTDKHAKQWEATLAAYARPILGEFPVGDVDTALVVRVLEPIWTGKTGASGRLRGRIEAILDWATVIQDGVTILLAGKGIWTICWPILARSRRSGTIPR